MTFGFTASFATASARRLGLAQAIVALFTGLAVVQTLRHTWVPVWEDAIRRLPENGEIRASRLYWPTNSPVRLGESPFLTLDVNVEQTDSLTQLADLGIELTSRSLKIYSLFGYLELPYPAAETMALNRASLEPWWGARKPFVLIGIGASVALGVFASWLALAIPYSIVVRVIAFYLDRAVTIGGAWKLAAAALLPGAVIMAGAIGLYGWQRLPLVGLLLAMPLHLVAGWIYLAVTPAWLPKLSKPGAAGQNPFGGSAEKQTAERSPPASPEAESPK